MKRLMTLLLSALLLLGLVACGQGEAAKDTGPHRLKVVATVFPAYDFARAAGGEWVEVTMLLPPGAESHSYEPTPADILAVQDCDLFLYLGGESDAWVDTILEAVQPSGAVLRMIDCVDFLEEETVEGMQAEPGHHHEDHDHEEEEDHDHGAGQVMEADEHVWTSPKNAAAITRAIGRELSSLDPAHQTEYSANTEGYVSQLDRLDQTFRDFFDSLEDRTIVFGDRFPLRYFAEEYGLDYYAAFPGCSTQTEPSAATIAFLTDKVRSEGISTIWYIEFSNHLVADSIAEAAGARTALFHTCHNVSREELESGATYITLMEGNLVRLQETMTR